MKLKLAFVVVAALLSGCVTGTRTIDLAPPAATSTGEASGTVYIGTITDKRNFEAKPADPSTPSVKGDLAKTSPEKLKTLIGRQRNGYGKAMGDVALPNGTTVETEMRDMLKSGLEARGYKVVEDKNAPITMDVDVDKFWAWFSPGMWSVSFEALVATTINVNDKGKAKEIMVSGYGLNKGQVASDANWQLTYQRAFEEFMKNLDKSLDNAGM